MVLSVGAETEFCKAERRKCEHRCKGLAMNFRCEDENGARSVACSWGSNGGNQQTSARSAVNVSLLCRSKSLSSWVLRAKPHLWN